MKENSDTMPEGLEGMTLTVVEKEKKKTTQPYNLKVSYNIKGQTSHLKKKNEIVEVIERPLTTILLEDTETIGKSIWNGTKYFFTQGHIDTIKMNIYSLEMDIDNMDKSLPTLFSSTIYTPAIGVGIGAMAFDDPNSMVIGGMFGLLYSLISFIGNAGVQQYIHHVKQRRKQPKIAPKKT